MLYDIVKSRRSIRKYQERQVEKEKVDLLLKSALLSPSSRSIRPWEFIVVTDKELLQKLSQCRAHSSGFLAGAPLGIVILADREASDVWVEDASIAAAFLQLTAQDLGLGSCWIQVRERFYSEEEKAEEYIKKVLDIPGKYSVECMIALGYPAEAKKPYDESGLPYHKLHYNKF